MFGHNRDSGIHSLRNYGDALHKYESTKDIRGRVEEPKRPLGKRRSVDMYSIRMREDKAIECVLYKTPVVTFCPDGLIELRHDNWNSVSTAYFIEEVSGFRARIFNNSLCVNIQGVESRMGEEPLRIMNGEVLNPTTDVTHAIDRKQANNVRKRYAEFVKYASALVRLKAEGFTASEYEQNEHKVSKWGDLGKHSYVGFADSVQEFFGLVNDDSENRHESHYLALLSLARGCGSHTWGQGYKITGCHLSEEQFKKSFENLLIGYHRDEVFVVKQRETGLVMRDPYSKYFQGGWNRVHANKVSKG